MLDDLKAFERGPPAGAPRLVVISPEQTREHALRSRVLLDTEAQATAAFDAPGTPMGVLIENGTTVSPVAGGADLELARAGRGQGPSVGADQGNDNGSHR